MIFSSYIVRLVLRTLLFLTAVGAYFFDAALLTFGEGIKKGTWLTHLIWAVLMLIIVRAILCADLPERFGKTISIGCKKHHRRYYKSSGRTLSVVQRRALRREQNRGALWVLIFWAALNSVIAVLYFQHVIDRSVLLLISLAYSVCDMICVVLFCPLQLLLMRNRCCANCRIFAWDAIMMCTPLLFIPSVYTWTLCGAALVFLLRWEWSFWRHPERFNDFENANLSCKTCDERLCRVRGKIRQRIFLNPPEKVKKLIQ